MWKRMAGAVILALALLVIAIAPNPDIEAQTTAGNNWTGRFFNDPTAIFKAGLPVPNATVPYPGGLAFNWPGQPTDAVGAPVTGVNADNFSAIFTTQQSFLTTGNYQFFGQVDDQIIVAIDGFVVFQQTTSGTFSFQYSVVAGSHTVAVGLVDYTGAAVINFQWQFIGSGQLGTPLPSGPIGRVVNVRGLSLRTGPYLGASFIAVLRPDNNYIVQAKSNDEGGGFTWFKVIAGERVGWASGRYLMVDTDHDTIPNATTIFDSLDGSANTGVIGVTRAVMNFRRRPSIRAWRIGQIPWGAQVEILNRTVQGGKNFWFHVRYNGQVGWIYAPYVGVRTGFIEVVPVR